MLKKIMINFLNLNTIFFEYFFSEFILFFLRKDFKRTKTHHKQKSTSKTKLSQQKERQQLLQRKTSKGEIVCFAFWCFFYAQTFFVKKKINRLEIVLITSFTILLLWHSTLLQTCSIRKNQGKPLLRYFMPSKFKPYDSNLLNGPVSSLL